MSIKLITCDDIELNMFLGFTVSCPAWWPIVVIERPPRDREVAGSNPGRVIPKTLKWYLLPSCQTLGIQEWRRAVEHALLPVD